MNIVTKNISELKPYENNPKIHTEKQIEQIAKSIELTKGLRQPIVIDKNNVIVCGHGRYLAAKKLGYDTVPCELVDDLTDDEIRAYRLIDNRTAQGDIDLSLEVDEISNIEIDLTDFDFPAFDFATESKRRMNAAQNHGMVFHSASMGDIDIVNPLQWFDIYDVAATLAEHSAPIHPIYKKMSVDKGNNCNGEPYFIRLSYATSKDLWDKGTLTFIKINYPDIYSKMVKKCPDISRFT